MEVIKIPREHVDACLFFRPGREDGELRGRDAVLRAGRTAGGGRGDGRQMLERMNKAEGGRDLERTLGRIKNACRQRRGDTLDRTPREELDKWTLRIQRGVGEGD